VRYKRRPDIENDLEDIYADPTVDPNEVPAQMPERKRRTRAAPEEPVYDGGDEHDADEEDDDDEEGEVEGNRQRYRNQRCKLRDRFVTSIKSALVLGNYRPIDPPEEEVQYVVKMMADPANNQPAGEVIWTNQEPRHNVRVAAGNTTYKGI
jgi:hypothetical protein